MNPTASGILAWLLTYAMHSTVLLGVTWLVLRFRRGEPAAADLLWKAALLGGILSATVQTAFELRPSGTIALTSDAAATSTLTPQTEWQADPDLKITHKRQSENTSIGNLASGNTASDDVVGSAWSISTLVAVAWAGTALILVLWYAARHLILVGRLGDRRVLVDGELPAMLDTMATEAGVSRRIQLTASQTISSPVALGRSEICLPTVALTELDTLHLRAILSHELAHLVRRDPIWLTCACTLERLFFFQPLNRLARRRMQESAEYLADEWAARQSGGVPLARCLVKVAEWIQASPLGIPVAGMAEERSQLAARVTRLLERSGNTPPQSQRRLFAFSSVALAATVWFAPGVVGKANGAVVPVTPDVATPGQAPATVGTPLPSVTPHAAAAPKTPSDVQGVSTRDGAAAPPDTAVVRALMARLKDEDADVRQAAAHSLGHIGDAMAIPALVVALDDPSRNVKSAALDALSQFEGKVPAAPIRRFLDADDPELRQNAMQLLGQMKDRASVPSFTKMLHDTDADVRMMAIEALAEIGDPTNGPAILSLLTDPKASVREQALSAIERLEAPISNDQLLRVLKDTDADVRSQGLNLAGNRKMVGVVAEIIRMLDDTDADVREEAADALTEMETTESRAALKQAMTHKDPKVRRIAVEYFGNRGEG